MDRVITLTTDFGTVDGYAGAVKGVLASLCPAARLVDMTEGEERLVEIAIRDGSAALVLGLAKGTLVRVRST